MFIIEPKKTKSNKKVADYTRCEVSCDKCGKEYNSSYKQVTDGRLKYQVDLCRSCRQIYQYENGIRDNQRASISKNGKVRRMKKY